MNRAIYRCLLRLHPAVFRDRFAAEMLWLYDEMVSAEGAAALLADGLASLARQWLVRRLTWTAAAAVIGGMLEVGLVLSLSHDVYSGRARAVKRVSISETAASAESDRPARRIAKQNPAASSADPPNAVNRQTVPVSALPVGDAPLGFAVLFGIVFVYACHRRRFQPTVRSRPAMSRRLSVDPMARQTRPAKPKPLLSIIAD